MPSSWRLIHVELPEEVADYRVQGVSPDGSRILGSRLSAIGTCELTPYVKPTRPNRWLRREETIGNGSIETKIREFGAGYDYLVCNRSETQQDPKLTIEE